MATPLVNAQLGSTAPAPSAAPGGMQVPGASPMSALPGAVPESLIRSNLARYIRSCFDDAKRHRETERIDERMIEAMRAMRGEYPPDVLADIKKYGGSEVYARLTASKVRGVSALLHEIYTAEDRPWMLAPTPDPELAGPSMQEAVLEVMQSEIAEVIASGAEVTDDLIENRLKQLRGELLEMRKKVAADGLRVRENGIDDLLWEGGFYTALKEALLDIATFPFGCVKGPVVERRRVLAWDGTKPTVVDKPVMRWVRCSPFDVYFAPWSQTPQDGYIIHRMRTARAGLQALIGLPNYDSEAIKRVLDGGKGNNTSWLSYAETERAYLEQRASDTAPMYGSDKVDQPMPMLEFHGPISGKMLREWGMPASQVPDETRDLDVIAYLIHDEVIGVRLNPHPAGFKPFYVESFDKVPGSIYGNGVPDLIADVQGVGNAALRALTNNLAMASGPMVYLDGDRLAENDPDPSKIWPWKVYHGENTSLSSSSNSQPPVVFFQPKSNAQELLAVYQSMAQLADELSSVPRHMQGNTQGLSGAGRTASGLSMMLEAGNRTIKQAVAAIDSAIIEPVIEHLNVYLALLRPDMVLEGDISVVARGAVELVQRETLRMRKLEFLQITNNPVDLNIVGAEGRYHLLRDVAKDLGMPIDNVLPNKPPAPNAAMMPPPGGAQGGTPAPGGTPAGGPPQQAAPGSAPEQAPNPVQGVAANNQVA